MATRAFNPPPVEATVTYRMYLNSPYGLCEHGLSAAPGWCLKCQAESKKLNAAGQLVKAQEGYER